jgi:DNA-directed RNA polymerase specialized sigma24 family protein
MTEIIDFLARSLMQNLASGMDESAARQAASVEVRAEFGGERVYVPSLPKQRRAVQLARLEMRSTRELAAASGMATRTVRRITRGR